MALSSLSIAPDIYQIFRHNRCNKPYSFPIETTQSLKQAILNNLFLRNGIAPFRRNILKLIAACPSQSSGDASCGIRIAAKIDCFQQAVLETICGESTPAGCFQRRKKVRRKMETKTIIYPHQENNSHKMKSTSINECIKIFKMISDDYSTTGIK